MAELIPGLPDHVAQHCLIRLPYQSFPTAQTVNPIWTQQFNSDIFHRLRSSAGLAVPVLALAQSHHHPSPDDHDHKAMPSHRLSLFEPSTGQWSRIPAIPGLSSGDLPLFCRLAAVGRRLVVVGGWDPRTWAASDQVHVFDFLTATWRSGARVPGPRRSLFACAAAPAAGLVFVAGGHDEEKNALRSAAAYDVARDAWAPLGDMARERDECSGAVLRGGLRVAGGYATEAQGRFSASAETFDLATWRWGPVAEDESGGATCSVDSGPTGAVYRCEGDGRVVVLLDDGGCRTVGEVPMDARVGTQLVACEGLLVVLGAAVHGGPLTAYVADVDGRRRPVSWRKVAVPEEYCGHIQTACCFTL